jgi:guanylate kinase
MVPLLDIDVQGAEKIKKRLTDHRLLFLFVMPPSI